MSDAPQVPVGDAEDRVADADLERAILRSEVVRVRGLVAFMVIAILMMLIVDQRSKTKLIVCD